MDRRKNLQKHSMKVDRSAPFLDWVRGIQLNQKFFKRQWNNLNSKFHLQAWLLVLSFCLLLSSIVFFEPNFNQVVRVDEVAKVDVKSPLSFQVVDEAATEEKRKVAEMSVAPVFDYDAHVYNGVFNRIYKSFREMREELRNVKWPKNEERREEVIKDFVRFKPQLDKSLGIEVPQYVFEWLVEKRFSPKIENILIRGLLNWSAGKIIDGRGFDFSQEQQEILVRNLEETGASVQGQLLPVSKMGDIRRNSNFTLNHVLGFSAMGARDQKRVTELARLILVPNLIFNRQETTERRGRARSAILPVQISVQKSQVIVSKGTVVRPTQALLLNEINNLQNARRMDYIALAVGLLFLTSLAVFFSYLRRTIRTRFLLSGRDYYAMGTILILITLLTKAYLFFVDRAFVDAFSGTVPASSLMFIAPVAAGSMLVGLIIPYGEIVWIFTLFLSFVVSLMVDPTFYFPMLLFAVVGGMAGARGVYSCKKRNDIYWAGLRAGVINAAVLTVVTFLIPVGEMGFSSHLIWNVGFGLLSGVLASMVTMIVIPLIESVFNYTTDVKLLELSSLNHPLMKEMIVKAPGTYHHSLVVGSMVEAAAEEIGANPLLGKVMAYYHDIGKMDLAQYFIENQKPGHNPHEQISPHMSKTVLVAHVKDGAEMGYRHKLGKSIIDGIRQHHGTTLIRYFYNKAIEDQDEDIDTVREADFRYPGPKPQFKEAALLMLADSIEAAARSIDEPTAGRLSSLVRNIIQNKFLDGQLEECDLTLKDLGVIENTYRRVIMGIYHHRIDYPSGPTQRFTPALPPAPSVRAEATLKRKSSQTI